MRQIKFRGKRVDNGEWVYGSYHYSYNGKHHYILALEKFNERVGKEMMLHKAEVNEVDPATVGQFTGLLDKNGKEIWEGDVIARRGMPNCSVEYGRTKFLLVERTERAEFRYDIDNVFKNHMEVIGSIHDNPELLTNK